VGLAKRKGMEMNAPSRLSRLKRMFRGAALGVTLVTWIWGISYIFGVTNERIASLVRNVAPSGTATVVGVVVAVLLVGISAYGAIIAFSSAWDAE